HGYRNVSQGIEEDCFCIEARLDNSSCCGASSENGRHELHMAHECAVTQTRTALLSLSCCGESIKKPRPGWPGPVRDKGRTLHGRELEPSIAERHKEGERWQA